MSASCRSTSELYCGFIFSGQKTRPGAAKGGSAMPTYHIRTYVPIFHSRTGDRAEGHLHSIELSLYLSAPTRDMLPFGEVEAAIDRCLAPYKSKFLNELPEFRSGADIEEIGEVFFARLEEAMAAYRLTLERFEIEETPLRTYIIRRAPGGGETEGA